ncbi:MAG: type II toxin-antitoxin system prevent-host-death family antitoxin [Roseovarius sp.]|nr:type II toxin-antitoxin system prevent-host-death family antitoxin [Roseovarius sp.]
MSDLLDFPAADLARRTGDVLDAASCAPVTITKHQKPRFVLMSVHRYDALMTRSEHKDSTLEDMPDDLKDRMIRSLEHDRERKEDRRLVDEKRTRREGRAKPSEVFARHFGETHGVDLPSLVRRGYRPLLMTGEEE